MDRVCEVEMYSSIQTTTSHMWVDVIVGFWGPLKAISKDGIAQKGRFIVYR